VQADDDGVHLQVGRVGIDQGELAEDGLRYTGQRWLRS
jgi:hypothetical protein